MFRDALRREDGMGMIEAMTAVAVLLGALLATFTVLDGSRDLVTVSERKEAAVHRAETKLEQLRTIPFATLELASAPGAPTVGDANDPRSWVGAGSPPSFDWDRSSTTNPNEPLVIRTAVNPAAVTPRETWTDGAFSGTVDTFVSTAGSGLKRITVAVRLNGAEKPRAPIVVSTLISQQAGATAP
jgi:type II secretory pathway pseudopilin PulG